MAELSGNTCTIKSIRPLGVTCSPTNASTPESQDGSIQLFISGGTSPYTVSWENGGSGNFIDNLQSGEYTATVTDYYDDYSVTVTCTVGNDSFYLDEFIKCSEPFNPNIYVFYDGASVSLSTLLQASENIRSWYQSKKNDGFGGLLYEGVIGKENHNSKNWLWWATYPYLGSLTGGTLSGGTVINSFSTNGNSILYGNYNSDWCQSSDLGQCVPRNSSFNFGTDVVGGYTSDIYKRINNGYTLTGPYGVNDTRSMGVPFTVTSSMNDNYETVYGDFIGGDINYICVIVSTNSNGEVGYYHGDVREIRDDIIKDDLFNNPFSLTGTGWANTTEKEPSNRFIYDYEMFLQVWEDIKNQNGTFNGFIYPLIGNDKTQIPFLQHTVASVEGDTITSTNFENTYGTTIDDVGPQNLNLSALTTTNYYSTLTTTSAYINLPSEYKNGAGLKNFDWRVNPTVSGFGNNVVGNDVDLFFSGISLSEDKIYTTALDGLIDNTIYKFSGVTGCYSYNDRLFYTGQTYSGLTITNTYDECIKCQPSTPNPIFQPTLCLSDGTTQYEFTPSGTDINNYFVWVNDDNSLTLSYNVSLNRWVITPWTNIGIGLMVRNVNETVPSGTFTNLGNTRPLTWTMTEGFCVGVPVTLTSQVSSETCKGVSDGAVILTAENGTPPYQYRVQNVSPYPSYSVSGVFSNLSAGNYLGEVIDDNGTTSSTIFTITQGEVGINYTVSLTSNVINNTNGSRTWTYAVQVNPALQSGAQITFDIVLTHVRVYRSTGISNFNYTHTITKNNNLNIPYTTSTTTSTNVNTSCNIKPTIEYTDTFTNTASSVTLTNTDTSLNGSVTQTVIIDGTGINCSEACRMVGTYNTNLQISNLSITGSQCSEVVNANTPVSQNITIYDCEALT